MACARPVVLSRTCGLWAPEELRDGENVVLTPPRDPTELARSVRLLLDDAARAAAIGAAARDSVTRQNTMEGYADRLVAVCRLALEQP
jgi:glycosyltransferase involved in cell wall biosynthesis